MRFHADRVAGGHRDHRRADRPAAAGGAGGAGVGAADAVRQQPQADRPGPGQLRVGAAGRSRRPTSPTPRPSGRPTGSATRTAGSTRRRASPGGHAAPAVPGAGAAVREPATRTSRAGRPDNTTAAQTKLSVFICPDAVGGSDGFSAHQYTNGDADNPNDGGPYQPADPSSPQPLRHQRRREPALGAEHAVFLRHGRARAGPRPAGRHHHAGRSTRTRTRGWPT